MDTFNSTTFTIRQLLKNEIDEPDRGKNYFIPPHQRKYDWNIAQVKKLIFDVYDALINKPENGSNPYFIGGIVLSKESMLGEERSKKSLEVIDGQQRLTSIVIILACIVQCLKFRERTFTNKNDVAIHLINDILDLLKKKSLNMNNFSVEEKYIVERSDNLSENFKTVLDAILTIKINNRKLLESKIQIDNDSKKLIDLIMEALESIDSLDDDELIDYTLQLLNNTWLVVTKTNSVETGFSIFEKLNDSGIDLSAHDLLKNYLFWKSSEHEYKELQDNWEVFLKTVRSINPIKTQITPREFLEQYLTITGNYINKKTTTSIVFNQYKKLQETKFDSPMKLLEDLILVAKEYSEIKEKNLLFYIDKMNFKLGYLIVLSFYKKYSDSYIDSINEILLIIFRIGFTYLIIRDSKNLSTLVPVLCSSIMASDKNIKETIRQINLTINSILEKKLSAFDEVISAANLFKQKQLTIILFQIIEFHLSQKVVDNIDLVRIMPDDYHEECSYKDINIYNCEKFANHIGNLVLDGGEYLNQSEYCFSARVNEKIYSDSIMINNISKALNIVSDEYISTDIKNLEWGLHAITERSTMIAKIASELIIHGKMKKDFFHL